MFEKEATDLCCSTCKAEVSCKEKCECWTFAKKGVEFGYNKAKEELEEENAVLKEQCSILADCNTCHSTCKNENIEMKKQLTKAKELIEELSSSLSVVGECGEEECELLNRAEQFLNSEVE